MKEYLSRLKQNTSRSTLSRLVGLTLLIGSASACELDSPTTQIQVPEHFVTTSCEHIEADDLNESSELVTDLNQQEAINNQINASVCKLANVVAKQTVSLYFKHPELFPRNFDDGVNYDFILNDQTTGSYSDIEFATNSRGVPIYSQLQSVMVGNTKKAYDGAISIDEIPITSSNKSSATVSGSEWQLVTEGPANQPGKHNAIPLEFDTTNLPFNATAAQLSKIQSEVDSLALYMIALDS